MATYAILPPSPRWCAACGQETRGPRCTNVWCTRGDRGWSVVYSVGTYEGELRRAIVGYKYRGQRSRAPVLAHLLAGYLEDHATWLEEYDLLTPMPAYLGRGARRPWDPVGRLAAELAKRVGPSWAIHPGLVEKVAETEPMTGQRQWERARYAEDSLRRALRPGPFDVRGARILVLDDVFTEGSTLREVARVLHRGGAEEVAGLVLARPALGRPAAGASGPGASAAGLARPAPGRGAGAGSA